MTVSADEVRVSVALCTHNGARFIEEQLTSILGQSRAVDEVVISDDASSDETLLLVDRFFDDIAIRRAAPTVTVLRNAEALGVVANFQQALGHCTGGIIVLCDQDDVWHADKVQRVVSMFEADPSLTLVHTDARMVDASGRATGETLFETLGVSVAERAAVHAGDAFSVLMRRNIVTGATVMLRRSLLAAALPFPASWVHDEWLAVVGAATGRIEMLEEATIDYRQHGGNQIGASSLTGFGRFSRLKAPRTTRNALLLRRASDLSIRAPKMLPAGTAEYLQRVADKLEHEKVRSALPASRVRRIAPIVREVRTGRYASCGLGIQDVVRDLVQPV